MDSETVGFLAGFLTMAGFFATYLGALDGIRAYRIKRKSYGSENELNGERVTGPFSFMAKRGRIQMHEINHSSLDRSYDILRPAQNL